MADIDRRTTTTNARGIDARAGVGHLSRLDDLDDYKVADGEPDIRGWDVKTSDRKKVGEVKDLLVDTAAMQVRYLDVELEKGLLARDRTDDRHVLIPIGQARLDDDHDDVLLPTLNATTLVGLPTFAHGATLTRAQERDLLTRFNTAGTTAAPIPERDEELYTHNHFNDREFFGKRRPGNRAGGEYLTRSEEELVVGKRARSAGEVEVEKHVETEHVTERVPVTREEVTVERRPATGMTAGKAEIRDDEIHVPVSEEEVVVAKRAVPKEEIVIKKHAVTDEKVVEADLRKERVDVEKNVDRNPRP